MSSPAFINRFYKTFSGTDTIAFILLPKCKPVSIGSVTTISYSMFRTKKPVINIGRTNINGVTRGARIYGGTMVFTIINQHWIANLADEIGWMGSYEDLKSDELPVFDIMVISANEYGSYITMYISGVDYTDEQQVISVEDMFTENVFQFIARDVSTFKAGKVLMTDGNDSGGIGENTNGYYVTDSSVATNEDMYNGYNEYVRLKNKDKYNVKNKTNISLKRDLYYAEV